MAIIDDYMAKYKQMYKDHLQDKRMYKKLGKTKEMQKSQELESRYGGFLRVLEEVRNESIGLHLQYVNVSAFLFKVNDTTYELFKARSYLEAVTKLELQFPNAYWEFLTEFRHSR